MSKIIDPPTCVEKPHALTYHGDTRTDPFYWLRERENPDVKAFLEKENEYTKSVIAGRGAPDLEKKLFDEMKARWKETDTSLPKKEHNFWYFSRTVEGLNYRIYCRRPVASAPNFANDFAHALRQDPDAVLPKGDDEQVIVDLNQVAKDEGVEFVSLGSYDVSDNENLVAMTLDLSDGNETYTIVVKDMTSGKEVQRIKGEIADDVLCGDNFVFYFTMDAAHRPEKLHRQLLGNETSVVMFTESDEKFWPGGLSRTDDEKYIRFGSSHKTSDEQYYLPISEAVAGQFKSFYPRTPKLEYNIEHHVDLFGPGRGGWLVNHNGDGCTNFRVDCISDAAVMADEKATTDRKNWKPFIKYDPNTNIEGVGCFQNFLLIPVRQEGFATVLLMTTAEAQRAAGSGVDIGSLTNVRSLMVFDDDATRAIDIIETAGNGDYTNTTFRVSVGNLIIPYRLVEVRPDENNAVEILKHEPVRGYDPKLYKVARIWATASKSTCDPNDPELNLKPGEPIKIPITIAYREDKFKQGESPCFLYAYGSYGMSIDPEFSSARVSLLDRGFVYALASVRGGGEMGRIWRNAGRMEHKMNTFTDFVDCGRHLIKEGWSSPDKLTACGRSAGGMLMGAIVNLAPDLWRTVIAGVPFVDCVTTMCDPTIPLTVPEWDEWGNPLESKEFYNLMKSYSPMDNIAEDGKTVFPNLFISSGLTDPRVAYWEPAAWCCRLRKAWAASSAADRYLVHKCVIGAGHAGSSGRYKHLEETAQEYSFLLQSVGIKE